MFGRQQATPVQGLVDRCGHHGVGHGRVGRGHIRDQVRCLGQARAGFASVVAGLGEMDLVAVPAQVLALGGPPGVEVIWGRDPGSARRETVRIRLPPPDHLPSLPVGDDQVVLHQDGPQHLHGGQLTQPGRCAGRGHGPQQPHRVGAVDRGQLGTLGLRGRQPPGINPGTVAPAPVGHVNSVGQPARCRYGQRFQAGPHTLPGQLQPVEVPDRRDHVRGVGTLLTTRFDQALAGQYGQ